MPWTAIAVGVLGLMALDAAATDPSRFYRVAQIDGAWWFVDPQGKPFFSSGVNVISPGPSRERYDPRRPAYAAFRAYPDLQSWALAANDRLKQWGFNTVGGWSAPEMARGPLPYLVVLHVGGKLGAPWNDLLHPSFAQQLDELVRQVVEPLASDEHLLGWCTDNELCWFPDSLFAYHISQPADQATRQALIDLLRTHYENEFDRLKTDFQPVDVASFDELDRGGILHLRPGGRGMPLIDRFTKILAEHYYRTMRDAIRRYDPNHLILGDRYYGQCPDVVAEAAGPYVDVLTTNYDRPDWTSGRLPPHYLARLHHLSGRPVLVTEYYVAARENRSGNKNTGNLFTTVETQEQRAAALRQRLSQLASTPFVVGAHWFQYTDEPTDGRPKDGEDYNFGLVDIDDRPYERLAAAFADVHREIPKLHRASANQPVKDKPRASLIPIASADPLRGIGHWDAQLALIPTDNGEPGFADMLACWKADYLYVAIASAHFVDSKAYGERTPSREDLLQWELSLNRNPRTLHVNFGGDDQISVSDPKVAVRLHQHGIRYTLIARIPVERFALQPLMPGDVLNLRASLVDRRSGAATSWDSDLRCFDPAQNGAEDAPPSTKIRVTDEQPITK